MTHFSFKKGKPLIWDFTCSDTVAASNISVSIQGAGKTAAKAEERKLSHYEDLAKDFIVTPVGVETFGSHGPYALEFLKDIGSRVAAKTGEPQAGQFLMQSISMAVQRGNVASILGSFGATDKLDEVFYL